MRIILETRPQRQQCAAAGEHPYCRRDRRVGLAWGKDIKNKPAVISGMEGTGHTGWPGNCKTGRPGRAMAPVIACGFGILTGGTTHKNN